MAPQALHDLIDPVSVLRGAIALLENLRGLILAGEISGYHGPDPQLSAEALRELAALLAPRPEEQKEGDVSRVEPSVVAPERLDLPRSPQRDGSLRRLIAQWREWADAMDVAAKGTWVAAPAQRMCAAELEAILDDERPPCCEGKPAAYVCVCPCHAAMSALAVAREFIAYYSRRGGCANCGGLPHTTTCFVGRFEQALREQPDSLKQSAPAADGPPWWCATCDSWRFSMPCGRDECPRPR